MGESTADRASLLVVFLCVFIDLLGFGIVLPLLPIYGEQFAADYGFSGAQMGWLIGGLMSSFSLMQFLFLPIWGRLSDRIGRRPVLIAGLLGSTVFYALFAVGTWYRSLALLFVARIGAGIAGATISTAQAYIADVTTPQRRAKGMALIGAAFALGFTLGPLIGATALLIGGREGVAQSPWPGAIASVFSGLALLLAAVKLRESWRPGAAQAQRKLLDATALREALRTPSVGLLLASSFIAVFSFANFESTLSLQVSRLIERGAEGEIDNPSLAAVVNWVKSWGYDEPRDVATVTVFLVFAYLGFVLTLTQGMLVRRLATRISEQAMALGGGLLAIAGFLSLAYALQVGSFVGLLIGMAIEVAGFAFVNPSLQSLISRRTAPERQGGTLGLAQSASSMARILGPVFAIRLMKERLELPYWFAAGLMAAALLMVAVAAVRGRDYAQN